jgi:hypothetical protein
MKKIIAYIPLVIILLIQLFDKEDKYFYVQIFMVVISIVYAIIYAYQRNKEE